jgi:hypothetical protein
MSNACVLAIAMGKNGWKPVRRGEIYCSPLCGGQCTHAAFLAVTEIAQRLAKEMGAGWEPVVSENLGWYWSIRKGKITIRPHGGTSGYWADFLSSAGQFICTATTARRALNGVLRKARNSARALLKDLEDAGVKGSMRR